jgi:hypothetical protein
MVLQGLGCRVYSVRWGLGWKGYLDDELGGERDGVPSPPPGLPVSPPLLSLIQIERRAPMAKLINVNLTIS